MITTVFDKTSKGREEIANRGNQLNTRQRTLLLLVDGKRDTSELMTKVAGLGLDEKALAELLDAGFIQIHGDETNEPNDHVAAQKDLPTTARSSPENNFTNANNNDAADSNGGILRDGENQFQALYGFFTETIRSAIGLHGYGIQLKVERASTVADFRELRAAYLEAVAKSKGPELELSLRNRLDQLLGLSD
jgi:hypothetical protein